MKNKFRGYLLLWFSILLTGCLNDSGSPDWSCENCIWKEDSQRIVVTESGGFSGGTTTIADYTKDTIPDDILNSLKVMKVTEEAKEINGTDFFIYHITITDGSGIEQEYYDNVELDRIPEQFQDDSWVYFSRDDMEELHAIIINNETKGTNIWNDQSQGFYFEAKGGHVGNGVSQDYFLDTLDSSVLTHLKSIKTTTDTGDSNCGGDRHFISLTIMDETGGSQTYNENQADGCWGDNSDRDNISRTDIETLMELIAVP